MLTFIGDVKKLRIKHFPRRHSALFYISFNLLAHSMDVSVSLEYNPPVNLTFMAGPSVCKQSSLF